MNLESQVIALKLIVEESSFWEIAVLSASNFGLIYFAMAGVSFFFSRTLCPALKLGVTLDTRPLFKNQIYWEISHSLMSIAIFGFYGALTIWAESVGLVFIDWDVPTLSRFLLDMLVLAIWNEIHFFVIHRMLHMKLFYRRVHFVHHRSTVTTPFSTYSFHPLESFLLSSVMILGMLFYDYNILVLMTFPLVSLFFNSIGHLNFTIFSDKKMNHIASASRRHAAHHRFHSGNYGFVLPYFDIWIRANIKDDRGA